MTTSSKNRHCEFHVGDRVVISHGEGTVVHVDHTPVGDLLHVEADIGGVWFRIPEEAVLVGRPPRRLRVVGAEATKGDA